jgi:hypothetical protein
MRPASILWRDWGVCCLYILLACDYYSHHPYCLFCFTCNSTIESVRRTTWHVMSEPACAAERTCLPFLHATSTSTSDQIASPHHEIQPQPFAHRFKPSSRGKVVHFILGPTTTHARQTWIFNCAATTFAAAGSSRTRPSSLRAATYSASHAPTLHPSVRATVPPGLAQHVARFSISHSM